MRFGWHAPKSDRTLKERGFDFAFASLIFDGPTLEREDQREDYGERRIVAMGIADGRQLTVVYTDRIVNGILTRWILSARRSNRRERTIYQKAVAAEADTRPR